MKKYLISGFNTVQDVRLEAGTYTLVAYVKSMYGNVYTFALGDGVTWTEYDIDVIQGQLCKVWLTFTIDKKVTKFKPIANNFTEELPVYVTDLQLTRGNIPVEAGASPFDVDKILNDLHDKIDAIEDFTEGAFLDDLLTDVEKTQLMASLDSIGSIVESVKGSYNKLLDNPFISNNTMNNITAKYNDFIASWISDVDPRGLKPVILWIVNGDNTISQDERDEKDRALNAFNNALYAYNQAEKEIYNDIGTSIDKAQSDANVSLAKTEGFTKIGDVNFPEGLIFTSLIKLLDAGNDGDEMAGISGITGVNKEDPAFWAGGTYNQAFDGTAKTIIRHDGSGQLAGGNIRWNTEGSTEFLGGIKSPFTDISNATIEQFWQEEITSWANNFFENQATAYLALRTIPCRNILNGQVFRIHALRRGIILQPEEYNGFYDNGELLDEIQLEKGDALEMVCICFDGVFHSWDIIRRYKCRPYDL